MKFTIGQLLSPYHDYYRPLGELVRTLQFLMQNSNEFRDEGRWGSSGARELLSGYRGCVNCYNHNWHSQRMVAGAQDKCPVPSWQMHHDHIFKCILISICSDQSAVVQWRQKYSIGLDTLVNFPAPHLTKEPELAAWSELASLHGHKLESVSTLNSCHRRVNVLCDPQLIVGPESVGLKCNVTTRQELRASPLCHSSWNVLFLLRDEDIKPPRWNSRRETFADFILRAVQFYKNIQQPAKLP